MRTAIRGEENPFHEAKVETQLPSELVIHELAEGIRWRGGDLVVDVSFERAGPQRCGPATSSRIPY